MWCRSLIHLNRPAHLEGEEGEEDQSHITKMTRSKYPVTFHQRSVTCLITDHVKATVGAAMFAEYAVGSMTPDHVQTRNHDSGRTILVFMISRKTPGNQSGAILKENTRFHHVANHDLQQILVNQSDRDPMFHGLHTGESDTPPIIPSPTGYKSADPGSRGVFTEQATSISYSGETGCHDQQEAAFISLAHEEIDKVISIDRDVYTCQGKDLAILVEIITPDTAVISDQDCVDIDNTAVSLVDCHTRVGPTACLHGETRCCDQYTDLQEVDYPNLSSNTTGEYQNTGHDMNDCMDKID